MFSLFGRSQCPFESSLQLFLRGCYSAPSEPLLHNLMSTLQGENEQVKSQIAFAHLVKVTTAIQSDQSWLRVLHQLILFDRLVEQNLFVEEIVKMTLLSVEDCNQLQGKQQQVNASKILKAFWKLIKQRATIYMQGNHLICQRRSHRRAFLEALKLGEAIHELAIIQTMFSLIFETVYYLQGQGCKQEVGLREWRKSGSVEYISVQLLYKLACLYSCQMFVHRSLLHRLNSLKIKDIPQLRRAVVKFRQNCNKLISFLVDHRGTKGFETMQPEQIKNFHNDHIIKFLDDYISHHQTEMNHAPLQTLPFTLFKMQVEKKPMSQLSKSVIVPRIPQVKSKSDEPSSPQKESNPFANWHSSFSNQFPQKEIMTVDLILHIKLEENHCKTKQGEQESWESPDFSYYRTSCNYDNRSTNITSTFEINYRRYTVREFSMPEKSSLPFSNIFSRCQQKWNK